MTKAILKKSADNCSCVVIALNQIDGSMASDVITVPTADQSEERKKKFVRF